MKIISFERLYNTEFLISEARVTKQYWFVRGNFFHSLDKPKATHTLLWFKNCSATLTLPDGEILEAAQNSLLYTAKSSQYSLRFHGTDPCREDTVAIHFQMTDKKGEDIAPTLTPVICLKSVDVSLGMLLDMLAEECKKNVVCVPEVNAGLYKILAEICQKQKNRNTRNHFSRIRRGIELLEEDNDLSIAEIAALCDVSECYFRRMFRAYSGESPMQFRQKHRMERAKQLLLSDECYTVGEVASELGFLDIYHFSKTFKKFCGVSPNKFLQSEGRQPDAGKKD